MAQPDDALSGWTGVHLDLGRTLLEAERPRRTQALRLALEPRTVALEAGDAGARVLESVDAWLAGKSANAATQEPTPR